MSDEQRDKLIERAMRGVRGLETHTPHGCDPASDDMTVEFAIKLSEQDAEIAHLRAELAAMRATCDAWKGACQKRDSELATMREAVDPFIRAANILEPLGLSDDKPLRECLPGVWPTVGDLRKARTAALQSRHGLNKAAAWWCGANCSCEGECLQSNRRTEEGT